MTAVDHAVDHAARYRPAVNGVVMRYRFAGTYKRILSNNPLARDCTPSLGLANHRLVLAGGCWKSPLVALTDHADVHAVVHAAAHLQGGA